MSIGGIADSEAIRQRAAALGPWFHNLDLGGVRTAPDHFLGDYPAVKWRRFSHALPQDLSGRSVLDIGCNGGFYSIEMKRRGARRVLGIDSDEDYLAQARFAAEVTGQGYSGVHTLDALQVEPPAALPPGAPTPVAPIPALPWVGLTALAAVAAGIGGLMVLTRRRQAALRG